MTPFTDQDRADLSRIRDELGRLLSLMSSAEKKVVDPVDRAALRSSMDFVMRSNIVEIDEQLDQQTLTAYQVFSSLYGLHRGLAEISSMTVGYNPAIATTVDEITQHAIRCTLRASAEQRGETPKTS